MNIQWQPTREDAYRAVALVTQGNCAGQIADTLYGTRGPTELARVRRLLEFASQRGILNLRPPTNEKLEEQLATQFQRQVTFHVVNNDQAAYAENPKVDEAMRADAVCHQAAETLAARISRLLIEKRDKKKRIVIANAGGLAVSRVVRFLAAQKILPEESDTSQLLFISLNSASMPTDYVRSANTLAVRMAEIYGGSHIAICPVWPTESARLYAQAVRDIDVLICGAGSKHSLLFTWLKHHAKIALPSAAVGDICLIPISEQGHEVPIHRKAPARIRRILHPHPSYSELQTLAASDRIILVAMGYETDDTRREPNREPRQTHSKLTVTRAILNHSLARTCVLGATLARNLLEPREPVPAP